MESEIEKAEAKKKSARSKLMARNMVLRRYLGDQAGQFANS